MRPDTQVTTIEQAYWVYPELPYLELRSTHSSPHAYKSHSHSELSIGAVISGEAQMTYKGAPYLVPAGSLVLVEPGAVHSCNPLPGKKRSYHMLYLNPGWCRSRMAALYPFKSGSVHCDCPVIRSAGLLKQYLGLVEALQTRQLTTASGILDSLANELFIRYCYPDESKMPERPLTGEIHRMLLSDLSAPVPLGEISRHLGVREESVIRIFRKDTGFSPRAFLNNARVEKAKSLLRAGQSIVDTAMQLGFSDQSHFHKTFVNFVAATPGQYQEMSLKHLFNNDLK